MYQKPAQKMAKHGRFGDTLMAHITPGEAALLKSLGGAGTVNPKTGALEFFNPNWQQDGWLSGTDRGPNNLAALPGDFNATEYLALNPDVRDYERGAQYHYQRFGEPEGRTYDDADLDFTNFDAAGYMAANPDLAQNGLTEGDAAFHFADFGRAEGRSGFGATSSNASGGTSGGGGTSDGGFTMPADFDPYEYIALNPDVAGHDAAEHYELFGQAEGRAYDDPNFSFTDLGFNEADYLAANQDVADAGMNPFVHYYHNGQYENRVLAPTSSGGGSTSSGNQVFTSDGYTAVDNNWWAQNGPANFDASDYLDANPDVAAASANPYEHYRLFGNAAGENRVLAPTANTNTNTGGDASTNTANTNTNTGGDASTNTASTAPIDLDVPAGFDFLSYLNANPDVAAGWNERQGDYRSVDDWAWDHYQRFGLGEQRSLTPGVEAETGSGFNFGDFTTDNDFLNSMFGNVNSMDDFMKMLMMISIMSSNSALAEMFGLPTNSTAQDRSRTRDYRIGVDLYPSVDEEGNQIFLPGNAGTGSGFRRRLSGNPVFTTGSGFRRALDG